MAGMTSEVVRWLAVVLIVGNVLAFIAGLSLLVIPKRVAHWLGLRTAHPVSVRRLTKMLETPRDSERAILRYPRMLGLALFVGGIFIFLRWSSFVASLSVVEGGRMLMRLFPNSLPAPAGEALWLTILIVILLGALLAMFVGGVALIRVQTLKKLSSFTNRWFSTRQAVKPVARPYYGIDRLVASNPQVWGGVIVLLSVYTLAMIAWFARGAAF